MNSERFCLHIWPETCQTRPDSVTNMMADNLGASFRAATETLRASNICAERYRTNDAFMKRGAFMLSTETTSVLSN